ncbi:hypothetical protein OG21DRAFT_1511009 [Imleria badia]|nr:hypothetical protein OG21DRAFT_1511009 [Imleria badia]
MFHSHERENGYMGSHASTKNPIVTGRQRSSIVAVQLTPLMSAFGPTDDMAALSSFSVTMKSGNRMATLSTAPNTCLRHSINWRVVFQARSANLKRDHTTGTPVEKIVDQDDAVPPHVRGPPKYPASQDPVSNTHFDSGGGLERRRSGRWISAEGVNKHPDLE